MDHFFTAVETREHPEYKEKPVVVGADPKEGKGRALSARATMKLENTAYGPACPYQEHGNVVPTQFTCRLITNFTQKSLPKS